MAADRAKDDPLGLCAFGERLLTQSTRWCSLTTKVPVLVYQRRAGTPRTVVPGATSLVTTAPPPTVAQTPTVRPGSTTLPMPSNAPSPTTTSPPRRAPGATCAKSPMAQSWSTLAPVLTIAPAPISAYALTTAPAMIATFAPIVANAETSVAPLTAP